MIYSKSESKSFVFVMCCYLLNCRDIYDKMRGDLRLMKEEAQRIDTSRTPKVSHFLLSL